MNLCLFVYIIKNLKNVFVFANFFCLILPSFKYFMIKKIFSPVIFFLFFLFSSENIFAQYFIEDWSIFFNSEKIFSADEKSFKIIDTKFATDKNSAFYLWQEILDSEPFSFEVLWWNYSKDFKNIYFEWEKISDFSKNYEVEYLWKFFLKNWEQIFLLWEKIIWDWESFEILWDWYTKDKNFVYLHNQEIIWAKPENFEILDFWYSKDSEKIFFYWEEIFNNFYYKFSLKNINFLSEKIFSTESWIFYNWEKISNNSENFFIIDENFSSDWINIFFEWEKLEKIFWNFSESNFEKSEFIKNDFYFSNWKYLYFKDELLSSNLQNLEFLKFWYVKTLDWIFYDWEKISSDFENFQILENWYSKDSENIFFGWNKISEDVENFEILDDFYAKDLRDIFLNWEKIFWEDLEIFLENNEKIEPFFQDVLENNKFFEAITFVKNQKIMTWYDWNIFKINQKINRAEFVKTLISAKFSEEKINICPTNSVYFLDLPFWIWYEKYVCVAKKNLILNWYSDWNFWWWNLINLAEVLKVLSKTYKLETSEFKSDLWYLEYYIFAKRNNLLDWLENLKVWDFLTRWEVAQIVYNFENY